MQEQFKIFIDRLKEGQMMDIKEKVSSEFLEIQEDDLCFAPEVEFKGKSYLADDHLVIHLDVKTEAIIPCKICNSSVIVPIYLNALTLTEALGDISSTIYDFRELLRENILLEIPAFAECRLGNCPERQKSEEYLNRKKQTVSKDHFFPFSSLDLF